jgi:hypothetical protein
MPFVIRGMWFKHDHLCSCKCCQQQRLLNGAVSGPRNASSMLQDAFLGHILQMLTAHSLLYMLGAA